VPVVMRALDVLVVPSTHDAQTLVIPQAFATGKPVIGSRVGGIPELVHQGKNGLLVKPGDVDELVQAMRFFLQHPKASREMGQAGLELARRELSYEVKMRQLQDSYAKAIGSKPIGWL
jgi:glycosyltransferase involved in cell wall biosynthesis